MSRPVGRDSENTKKFIKEVATKIFDYKGYTATSMEDIKKETNLSKGTIYYHFKNKEDLYLYCLTQASNDFVDKWGIISKKESNAEEKLYSWAKLNSMELQQPLTNTIPEYLVSVKKDDYTPFIDMFKYEFDIIQAILEEGKKSGEFKSDLNIESTTHILFSLISSLSNSFFFGYKTPEGQRNLYTNAIDIIIHGLKA
ncbi:TetR/AcrR family transcriptional regulator [Metabacillus endolithicus]|uniref:TetR/AcrR family transcriptional regulator n=1 Tax=Metabacillus endolithicus TaxID=1535204 RepID=A0ABW5C155_9BACI|nr:TetR/AcrR family transcriptional regulator [Metabacillus endolithicus]UPG62585.1 TetR/AcrR family transcriptional regulator [Metabacillus endolithicus]